jgi:hypothetical protein
MVKVTAVPQNAAATGAGITRFPRVTGPTPLDDGTGINWDPPYPNSGSSATSPAIPTGPELDWRSFDGRRLDDGDRIVLTTTQTNGPFVTIKLTTPSNVTWWKDIEVQDWTGTVRASAWTSDSLHSGSLAVPNDQLAGLSLHFMKAKFLGVHTDVYEIPNMIGTDGYELAFDWQAD